MVCTFTRAGKDNVRGSGDGAGFRPRGPGAENLARPIPSGNPDLGVLPHYHILYLTLVGEHTVFVTCLSAKTWTQTF